MKIIHWKYLPFYGIVYSCLMWGQFDIKIYINNNTSLTFNILISSSENTLLPTIDWNCYCCVLNPYQVNNERNLVLAVNSHLPCGKHQLILHLYHGTGRIALKQNFNSDSEDNPCKIELEPCECTINLLPPEIQGINIFRVEQETTITYWIVEQKSKNKNRSVRLTNNLEMCTEKKAVKIPCAPTYLLKHYFDRTVKRPALDTVTKPFVTNLATIITQKKKMSRSYTRHFENDPINDLVLNTNSGALELSGDFGNSTLSGYYNKSSLPVELQNN